MSSLIHLPNMQSGYIDLIEHVLANGRTSSPRGQTTIEVEDAMFTVDDLRDTIPTRVGRKPNLMIAAVEALQLISGTATPELIVAASPAFAKYREGDGEFWGAYGRRIGPQAKFVVDKLRSDAASRQAIISLWNPDYDNITGKKDYPCTLVMGFRIRNRRLNMSVTMRSNDLWLGTCYDVFQFTQLQLTIAHMLGIEPGTYSHTAWSLHIYERDLPAIDELHQPRSGVQFIPDGLPSVNSAAWLLSPPTSAEHEQVDPAMRWYRELVLRAYTRMNDASDLG